jgi:hypothetical protein
VLREARKAKPIAGARSRRAYFERESPPTLVIDEIETLWQRIAEHDDWSAFERKVAEIHELGRGHGR